MLQSISATGASPASGGGLSPASLQAQLQRFQQQLSDCVNCASAKTPEGKTAIQALAAKVSQVERKISALQDTQAPRRQRAAADLVPQGGAPEAAAAPDPASPYRQQSIGATINVYA